MGQKIKKILAALFIGLGFLAVLVIKLMQSAAHREEFFDWEYIFSWPNIESSLWTALAAVVTVALYFLCKRVVKKFRRPESNGQED